MMLSKNIKEDSKKNMSKDIRFSIVENTLKDGAKFRANSSHPAGSSSLGNIGFNSSKTPQKPKEKLTGKQRVKRVLIIVGVILGFMLGITGYMYVNASAQLKAMGIEATPSEIIAFILSGFKTDDTGKAKFALFEGLSKKGDELKRDSSNNYTNVLIIGIDTRANDNSLLNTDTLMIGSYNYTTEQPVLISIPRDLLAEIPGTGEYIKISGIYGNSEYRNPGSGMGNLQTAVETVTGMEIQYYAMINLQGFVQVIDTIGGVTVDVENSFTDYRYPNNYDGRLTEVVSFQAGSQTMDGATALQYARSRHSLDNGEGSDFARARRQQRVIKALVAKLMSSEVYTNPQKILELVSIVQDNVKFSGYTIEDIKAGLAIAEEVKDKQIYSFVLDPSISGYTILTDENVLYNGYAIAPISGLGNYSALQNYVNNCLNAPAVISENAYVLVYDTGAGYDTAYSKMLEIQNAYPSVGIGFMGTYNNPTSGIVVFDQTNGNALATVQAITELLSASSTTKPDNVPWGLYGESVTVLVGAPIQ